MSASGIIAVFMTVIQLLFPMMGDVSYQGLYELEVDGVPFSCRLSLDTDDPTLDATVQAEGSPCAWMTKWRSSTRLPRF